MWGVKRLAREILRHLDLPPANFVLLEGLCARHLGRDRFAPYDAAMARRVWEWGYDTPARRGTERNVPRETRRGAGDDYGPAELDLLAWADGDVPARELAALLGRSPSSVAVKLSRLRKRREAAA